MYLFHNKAHYYGEELLATRSTPKLEDNPLLTVHECLFNIFAATHHIGSLYSIRNHRTCRKYTRLLLFLHDILYSYLLILHPV